MSLAPVSLNGPDLAGLRSLIENRAAEPDAHVPAEGSFLNAQRFTLDAQSLSVLFGSGGSGGRDGGGALRAIRGALGARPGTGASGLAKLRESLEKLGLSDENIRDLMLLAQLLAKLDPEAYKHFAKSFHTLAEGVSDALTAPATGGAPAASPAASGFRLNYVSVSISITEMSARFTEGPDGSTAEIKARRIELRLERLEISMSGAPLQQGDPLVLDVDGDGIDLRPTSDGVLFDLAGTGETVQTAFVAPGDDAVLFYDSNGNGRLDGGGELVGNRVAGLNAFEELAGMDEDGDGLVTSADPAWDALRAWQDLDGDGRASAAELSLLDALGLEALSVLWKEDARDEGEGLTRVGTSEFTRDDGSRGVMVDYLFGYRGV